MEKKVIKFKKLVPQAEIPTYAHDGDIGMDIKCVSVEYDKDNDVYICGTGLACETTGPMGVHGMMRSSIYKKGDCYLVNAVGLIDSDQYRGEIKCVYRSRVPIWQRIMYSALRDWGGRSIWYKMTHKLENLYFKYMNDIENHIFAFCPYHVGDVCGQLVPITFDIMKIEEVDELSETERGTGGHGSTGN